MTREHDQLPLPEYDHLPVEVLRQRLRTLDREQVQLVLAYEAEHGDRLVITQLIRARLDDLEAGAEPSGGDPGAPVPQVNDGTSPAARSDPSVDAPAMNPPSQGDPTNPAQPR
jgi:hypothetical protein